MFMQMVAGVYFSCLVLIYMHVRYKLGMLSGKQCSKSIGVLVHTWDVCLRPTSSCPSDRQVKHGQTAHRPHATH